jgi:sulfate adenylyltransferase subunit 1
MELLRFITAGSVDDGKSTLIGRLLCDSKAIFEDQVKTVERSSKKNGDEYLNYAFFTDGLKAEREQGITIDVAYRFFNTHKRKFIIADTPGHVQYTRNMVTGASTADIAVVLIDAKNGILEQTLRHLYIAYLLGIQHVVCCINKMDLVNHSQQVFQDIINDLSGYLHKIKINNVEYVPISALNGDNVLHKSVNMSWYTGYTLMHILENIPCVTNHHESGARFPVQHVIYHHNNESQGYRGYAGQVVGGCFQKGDKVQVLPSGYLTRITSINSYKGTKQTAYTSESITFLIEDNIDVGRGDMIVKPENMPKIGTELDIMICWFSQEPLMIGRKYSLKHTTNDVICSIKEVKYKINMRSLEKEYHDKNTHMNDIVLVTIKTAKPIFYDSYYVNRATGSLIIIDNSTNETVAAGMIV